MHNLLKWSEAVIQTDLSLWEGEKILYATHLRWSLKTGRQCSWIYQQVSRRNEESVRESWSSRRAAVRRVHSKMIMSTACVIPSDSFTQIWRVKVQQVIQECTSKHIQCEINAAKLLQILKEIVNPKWKVSSFTHPHGILKWRLCFSIFLMECFIEPLERKKLQE